MPTGLIDDREKIGREARLDTETKQSVAEKISDQFDAVFGHDEDRVTPEPSAKEPASTEVETVEKTEGDGAESVTPAKEEAETETKPEAAADEAPTLPAGYIRSLKAAGWEDDEIREAVKTQGVGFTKFADKVHQTRNAELARMAELGRQSQAQRTPAAPAKPAAEAPATGLKPFDVKALRAKYGDDGLIDELVGPVNQVIEQLNRMSPQVQQYQNQAKTSAEEALGKQVDQFFSDPSMKQFHDVYGTSTAKATDAQLTERAKVLQFADALVAGGSLQGRRFTVEEALAAAHDATSAPKQKTVAREEIRDGLKQRQKSITLRPSGKAAPASGAKDDRKALEDKVGKGLAKLFGK